MRLDVEVPYEAEALIEAEAKRRQREPEEYVKEVMAALRAAAREFLSDPERAATAQESRRGDESYERFLLARLAPFFAPGWLEAETDEAIIARGYFARVGALQLYVIASGPETDGGGGIKTHTRVEFLGLLGFHHLGKAVALANTPAAAAAPPKRSLLSFRGAAPWDGADAQERINALRDEWDDGRDPREAAAGAGA